jgi:hypothetical protein
MGRAHDPDSILVLKPKRAYGLVNLIRSVTMPFNLNGTMGITLGFTRGNTCAVCATIGVLYGLIVATPTSEIVDQL